MQPAICNLALITKGMWSYECESTFITMGVKLMLMRECRKVSLIPPDSVLVTAYVTVSV